MSKKISIFVLFISWGSSLARPSTALLGLPTLNYALLTGSNGAPLGADGRVVDTPEVAIAKIQHNAAQLNERETLANEAARSGGNQAIDLSSRVLITRQLVDGGLARLLANQALPTLTLTGGSPLSVASLSGQGRSGSDPDPAVAPVGSDGRVVDTPAVAQAKVEHAAAHANEKIHLANELAARTSGVPAIVAPSGLALRL